MVNTVLENAGKESRESDDTFRNPWILIQQPDQKTIDSKPTAAPLSKLSAKFVNQTNEQLQAFVEATFGSDGLGHNDNEHNDFLANDAFGVIDARTKQDGSIAFFAQETVDPVQEAEVRVAWDESTEFDEALVRFANEEETDEDEELLLSFINLKGAEDPEAARTRLEEWLEDQKGQETVKWFQFRLDGKTAVQCTCGIYERGASDSLLKREEDFDEEGVMH